MIVRLSLAALITIAYLLHGIEETEASRYQDGLLLGYILNSKGFSVPPKGKGCGDEGKWQFGHYDEGWGWKLEQAPCDPIQDILLKLIAKAFHLEKKEEKIELIHAKGDAKAKVITAKGEAVAAKKGILPIHEEVKFEKHEPDSPAKHPEESAPIVAFFTPIKEIEQQIAQSQLFQSQLISTTQLNQQLTPPQQLTSPQQQSNAIPPISN